MQIIKKTIEMFTNPSMLLVVAFVIFVIGKFFFKIENGKCLDIIKKHLGCFRKSNGKMSIISIVLCFGVPMLLSFALAMINQIDESAINIITIIISILTSMFFTLLTLVLDIKAKVKVDTSYSASDSKIISDVLKETYYSIMFEILVSIILLIFCFLDLFASNFSLIESIVKNSMSCHRFTLTLCHNLIHFLVTDSGAIAPDF